MGILPDLVGALFLVVAGIATHRSRRVQEPMGALLLWIVYVLSLIAGLALVAT